MYLLRSKVFLEIHRKLVCDAFFPPIYCTFLGGAQCDGLFMNCYEVALQPL